MIKLNLGGLSFVELLESYDLLIKRRSKDIDEIHQYLVQMLKVGTSKELKTLEKYLETDDPFRTEVIEAIKNRQ